MRAPKKTDKEMEIRVTNAEKFFASATVPAGPIQLDQANKIVDVEKFLRSHLETVKACSGSPVCRPYMKRLEQFGTIIQKAS